MYINTFESVKDKNSSNINIHWYPGHMTKAKRVMKEDMKLIDLVIELVDARVPLSSRNPDIDGLGQNKARVVLLNKSDLADDKLSEKWAAYFREKGYYVLKTEARNRSSFNAILPIIQEACKAKIERDKRRGIMNRPVRAMVAGIPNVGKSTFINSYARKASTKTGNKPGVTRGNQWIRLDKSLELLDTPGILWPKFEDQIVGLKLALIGSIKDDLLDKNELAIQLIKYLKANYSGVLNKRYEADETLGEYDILKQIAVSRSCLLKGGEYNIDKAAMILLDDFRSGKLGKITLESPFVKEDL